MVGVKHLLSIRQKEESINLSEEKLPKFSIIVPAKNEEKVIERLLKALLDLNYPPSKKEIIIIEDGSTDKTVEICEKYAKQHSDCMKFLRQSTSNGKASALNSGLKTANGEIIGVFDADNVPEPDILIKTAKYFTDKSVAAVQGKACSINADENMLTKLVSYEEEVRFETYLRGKDALKLFVPLTGSGYFIRKNVLENVGGWNNEALSEDIELSVKLTEKGYNIKYASDVQSWQENPSSLIQLIKQRTRWFRGCMETAIKYGKLLKTPSRKCLDAEITLFGPSIFAVWLIIYITAVFTLLAPMQPDPLAMIMAQTASLFTASTLFIAGLALVYITKPRKITNLLWLPFIYIYWSLQTFIAIYALLQILLKRPRKWTKTMKTGAVTNSSFKNQFPIMERNESING
jgi:cellulose synthase/poly-beta-1,6-N-acetylglucosamine synthase-like glycosyltransferase